MSDRSPLDRMWDRGRLSTKARLARLRSKSWHIAQASVAAGAADQMAGELARGEMASEVRSSLLAVGRGTAEVERHGDLSADVMLAQIRSIIVDLLQITGLDTLEATDALPPPRR